MEINLMMPRLIISIIIIYIMLNSICISLGDDNDEVTVSETSFPKSKVDSGGSSTTPRAILDINITLSKSELNRSEHVVLTMDYYYNKPNGGNKNNITYFYHPEYLDKNLKVVEVNGEEVPPFYGEIGIGGILNSSERKSKNWTLETSTNIEKGEIHLLNSGRRNLQSFDAKSKRKMIHIIPKFRYFYENPDSTNTTRIPINGTNIIINIKNNKPQINETETRVNIDGPQIDDQDKLIYWDVKNPLNVNHFISASDVENNKTLGYVWILEDGHNSSVNFETNQTASSFGWNLRPNENYTFKVRARDLEGDYSNTIKAKIFSSDSNKTYDELSTPSWEFFSQNLILIISIAILILILHLISIFYRYQSDFCVRKSRDLYNIFISFLKKPLAKAIILIVITTFIFIPLYYSKIVIGHIYTISLAFYELYIFIITFILFCYAAEDLFFKKDNSISKYCLPILNTILMISVLASFYGIISGINQDLYEHLIRYYSTIIQVSGTLLGIILGFYVAQFDSKKINSKSYLKALEYLVVLYGVLIGLSFWGLSSGATISFTPLIEFNQENLPNIFSIWVFEATLLLIPLAITSLYRLIKVNR
jgi:hypothetical protein